MAPEYCFIRHGESIVNVSRTISNRPEDYTPLTKKGREQAESLRETLRERDVISIYSSPLTRARETAEILSFAWRIPVTVSEALREPECGELEGRNDDEAWKLHALQEEAWTTGDHGFRLEGGESLAELSERFVPFIRELTSRHEEEEGTILIVSHGSLLMNLLPSLVTNLSPEFTHTYPLKNCTYVSVEAYDQGLVCTEWDGNKILP